MTRPTVFCKFLPNEQYYMLHTSSTGFSSSQCCCIIYTCICLLQFLWNNNFVLLLLHVYLQNEKKTMKEEKKDCDVIKFEIKLIFLIKPFCYMTKKLRQKLKYLENENSIWGEIKAFFIILKGLSVAKNCLRPESAPLTFIRSFFHIVGSNID